MYSRHNDPHFSNRNNWLRAGVLGANDGLISTSALLMGMAAARPDFETLLLTGFSALIGGAISMAAGEYVSVSSQADTEKADLRKEQRELELYPQAELEELATIYTMRGLQPELARQVAEALTQHNALDAHARDEIGLTDANSANPLQAAGASALSFSFGSLLPLAVSLTASEQHLLSALSLTTLGGLAVLGWFSAKLGGAQPLPAIIRITVWGTIALSVTGLIGKWIGSTV